MVTSYPIERWLQDGPDTAGYAAYWDDPATEEGKPFDVSDGDYGRLERYLGEVGLTGDLRHCLAHLGSEVSGTAIDLAAGTLWAVPTLLKAGAQRVYCVEYSRHRLLDIGPRVLDHYGVAQDEVVLAYGSFYDLHVEPSSCRLALLSQAFHHADEPDRLLAELARVLEPGGVALLIGEHRIAPRQVAVYAAKCLLSVLPSRAQSRLMQQPLHGRPSLRPAGRDLAPVDPVMGDHVYTAREYERMFTAAGFEHRRVLRPDSSYQAFVLERPS